MELNPQQRAAVEHSGTPLLIVAGAGSGKTAVLTRRIAYLLEHEGVKPWNILAITFTNKAALEMKERVSALVGPQAEQMLVATFHAACVRILRAHAHLVPGLSANFTIYDADDARRLLQQIVKDRGLDVKEYSPRRLATLISRWKDELTEPEGLSGIVADVYAEYQSRLRRANAVDFDDLIAEVVRILRDHPDIAQYYRNRYTHVLVDEYQDTNIAQYNLVKLLVGDGSGLCVVGDADQSIYAFRGATIRNIDQFEHDFPTATTIVLEQNYRSTQNILTAANAVISRNENRREKRLWTDQGDGPKIVGYVADDEQMEARYIADEIDRLTAAGVPYADMAVMYRTNASSRVIEDVFIRTGLPYKVVGGTRFYERMEVRDILAYLKVVLNPADEVSLRRIVNTPRRGIGDTAMGHVAATAQSRGISLFEAMKEPDGVRGPAVKGLSGFVELIESLQSRDLLVGDLLMAIIDESGYRKSLEGTRDPQDEVRLENLEELVAVAREFSAQALAEDVDASAEAFMERVALVADADQIPDSGQGVVTLMTLHTAKGLEFPVVFLPGWEDGLFPHVRSLGNESELSEERRLAYVGITRAKQRLYISRALRRSTWGAPITNPQSRFIGDLPDEVVEWVRTADDAVLFEDEERSWGGWSSSGYRANRTSSTPPQSVPKRAQPRPLVDVQPGERVVHDKYGLGTVKEVTPTGKYMSAMIDFGSAGTVRLMLVPGTPIQKL
ncbi:MAG: 3'-5' exonuclease [Corynebacterium sp.]|nr:3'-5' exonuclease [Corynebacterium sp.]